MRAGPLFFQIKVKNENEPVALANDPEFGSGGSVFTEDVAHGKHMASRVDTSKMFINQPAWTASDLPFGGIKNSGYGRELASVGAHCQAGRRRVLDEEFRSFRKAADPAPT